ncbi:MAG: 3-hydroxyacyl-ACP dehydratase FabZ family protein [Bacillota bacterium]
MQSQDSIIHSTLPQRYPFLMIDKILEVVEGKTVKGLKNITANEWYITDDHKVMPNCMIVEALAQLGAFATIGEYSNLGFLTAIKGANFIHEATVGDQVYLYYEVKRMKKGFVLGIGHAEVNGQMIVKVDEILIYQASSS